MNMNAMSDNAFWAVVVSVITGLLVGTLFAALTFTGFEAYNTWFNRENEPMRVRIENAHKALHDLLNDWPEGVR